METAQTVTSDPVPEYRARMFNFAERYISSSGREYYTPEEAAEIGRLCLEGRRLSPPIRWKTFQRCFGRSRTQLNTLMRRAEQAEALEQIEAAGPDG